MSLPPLLIIFACLVPLFGFSVEDIIKLACSAVPDVLDDFVARLVVEAHSHTGAALSLAILALLWTVTQWARALRRGLNSVYEVEEHRSFIGLLAISIAFIAILMVTMLVMICLIFGDSVLRAMFGSGMMACRISGIVFRSLFLFVAGTFVIAACYTFFTAGKRRLSAQLPGAAFTAIAWFIFSFAFYIYVENSNRFSTFYGSIGIIAIFLFWMYCIFYILLLGGFINHEWVDWIEAHIPLSKKKTAEDADTPSTIRNDEPDSKHEDTTTDARSNSST